MGAAAQSQGKKKDGQGHNWVGKKIKRRVFESRLTLITGGGTKWLTRARLVLGC